MNDFKIIRAMLLGVAFTNLLSAATCYEEVTSYNNLSNKNYNNNININDFTHINKTPSLYNNDNNKTISIYQQDILGQSNYLLNLQTTKKDILKRAILSEDIILKQKLDIEEIFNKQNALDAITVIGENLKRDESYIQSAIYALNILGIKSDEMSKLTKLPLKSSNYNEVLKLYDSVQKTKSDLMDIRDKKLTPSNISDGDTQGSNINQEGLIKAIDNIKHNIPRLSITSSLESIDTYIDLLNKISKPNNDKTSINDFIADVRILQFFNVNIDNVEKFDPDPMYDYTYDYDEFNKIYKEAYGIANNQVQAYVNDLLNILKNQMEKALKLKYIKEEIEYFKNNNKQDELKKAMDEYKFIVFDSNRFNDTQERIFNALNNSDNKIILDILNQNNSEKIRDLVYATERSLKDVSSVLSSSLMLDMIGLNSQLAINNRLAKINNPYNANMALANIIKNLKDEPLANTDDMALLSLVANKAQNPTSLYKSFIGAKAKVNTISPRIYGVTFGYDVLFQDLLLGSFITYAKSKINTEPINQKTNSYQAGIYSRYSFLNSELDTKLSLGISQNDITRMMIVDDRFYTNKANYKSLNHSFSIDYGYLFRPNEGLFIKPIIGLLYFYSKNNKFKESGFLAMDFLEALHKSISLNLATELRYYNDANYFYIALGMQREIYKRVDDININFADINIPISIKDKKHTYFTLQAGADFTLTNKLSANANFGIKASKSQRYYNGTIGLKWLF